MTNRYRLLVAISDHGFGHVAQTAPVVNALRRRVQNLHVTLVCGAPTPLLTRRFAGPFDHARISLDVGMHMASAVTVLVDESAAAYREFHDEWDHWFALASSLLRREKPDLVLANVPYVVVAAARAASVPVVAMCSLNWAEIYRHFCGDRSEAGPILEQISAAYRQADWFIQPEPSMPMRDLGPVCPVGPIARMGVDLRAEIDRRFDLTGRERLVLVAPGGLPMRLPVEDWPDDDRVRWIVQADWAVRHPQALVLESLDMHFVDVLRSCDALITKPGYGSFTEAVCNRVPLLYLARPGWPEAPALVDWLHAHGRAAEIDQAALIGGDLVETILSLCHRPLKRSTQPTGEEEAASLIEDLLRDGSAPTAVGSAERVSA